MVWDYLAKGKPNSYEEIKEHVAAAGCSMSIKGKTTEKYWRRKHTLTIKGGRAWEMYNYIWEVTSRLGCNLSKIPLAQKGSKQEWNKKASDSDSDSQDSDDGATKGGGLNLTGKGDQRAGRAI